MGDKFIILRCEGHTKAADIDFSSVKQDIYEDIHDKKLQRAMTAKFEALQEAAVVDNYLAGTSHSPKDKLNKGKSLPELPTLEQVPAE